MKKYIYIFIFMFVFETPQQIHAQDNVSLRKEVSDPYQHGGRDIYAMPTATLDGTELTLSYPLSTESQVILIDQSTQTTVYSETFAASRSVVINLAEEGIEEGTYTLRVYAFGKWWWGEFRIANEE